VISDEAELSLRGDKIRARRLAGLFDESVALELGGAFLEKGAHAFAEII
jgi:hypothetical protein